MKSIAGIQEAAAKMLTLRQFKLEVIILARLYLASKNSYLPVDEHYHLYELQAFSRRYTRHHNPAPSIVEKSTWSPRR